MTDELTPQETVAEFMKNSPPPGPFNPKPYFLPHGDSIVWYWSNDQDYSKAIHSNEKFWVGSLYVGVDSENIVGVRIHIDGEMQKEISDHYIAK